MGFMQRCIVISMLFVGFGFGFGLGIASATKNGETDIKGQCSFTRYPSLCVQTLLTLGSQPSPSQPQTHLHDNNNGLELSLLEKIMFDTTTTIDMPSHPNQKAQHILDLVTGEGDGCYNLVSMSMKWLNQSLLALRDHDSLLKKKKQDVQTWLSAALTFQQTCRDWTKSEKISKKMEHLSKLTSIVLAFVNRKEAENNGKIPTHNDSVGNLPSWSWMYSRERRVVLEGSAVEADAVVAKDGSGNFETISEAIKAASGKRFVIYVKSGVYKEKIHTDKDGITLIGDGKYSTIISGDDSVAGRASLSGSATFTITGHGFIARDIGFQNNAGPEGQQALALTVASDHAVLYRCSIAGYQDSLYALALRHFYRECDIYGTIDFIFGNAAAMFQNCYLVLRRPKHGGYNVILANGRSDPGQNTGFSLQRCRVIPSSGFSPVRHSFQSFLGRPWKEYSRSVVMQSDIDDCISSRGWVEWPGAGSSSLKTLYFAEYANTGPGASTSGRVKWPGFHVIDTQEATKFTVQNFIYGTSWLPSTGVTFVSGLE